jgi:ATP-binding cassette subfamily B (MDR/TAP) protein 1
MPTKYTDDDSSENQPLLDSGDSSDVENERSVRHITQWERHAEPSLATVQPQAFESATVFRQRFIRQILGMNPFKTSYFTLYTQLDDAGSKAILGLGVILAVLAGLPLPLIGIVLGRIINNFPPTPEELKHLLYRLMSVAVGYFVVTWGWAVCWAVIGERVSRKTRERLLHRALGMDMAYFGVLNFDAFWTQQSSRLTIRLSRHCISQFIQYPHGENSDYPTWNV